MKVRRSIIDRIRGVSETPEPTAAQSAVQGLCPQCGSRTLFAGLLRFAPRCRSCGLDFAKFNVGDGAAAFLILIVGGFVSALAIWLQLRAEPPFWVHVLLWVPLTTALVIGGLRVTKAWLLQTEYRQKAAEHRHDGSDLS